MNETLQIFIYIVGGMLILFIIIFAYFAFVVISTFQRIRAVLDNIDLVKKGASILKQGTVLTFLNFVSKFLDKMQGGDSYGKKR